MISFRQACVVKPQKSILHYIIHVYNILTLIYVNKYDNGTHNSQLDNNCSQLRVALCNYSTSGYAMHAQLSYTLALVV